MRFIPAKTPNAGSQIGNSYLAKFARCPRDWFNTYYRPFQGGHGIQYRFTSEYLSAGRSFHEGIAELYRSGVRDGEDTGEWDIDRAIARMQLEHTTTTIEYESQEKAEETWQLIQSMLLNYHDEFCLTGNRPDFPTIRVLCDGEGSPLIEREFSIDLGFRDYVFTCRVDMIVSHHGYPKIMEHKTSAPGMWVGKRLASIHTDSQFTGECLVMASLFPEELISEVLCNVVIKRGKTEIARRESTRRDHHDFNSYRLAVLDILESIDHRVEGYTSDIDRELPELEAINRWFPDHGTRTGACEEYSGCQFKTLCLNKSRNDQFLQSFVPRSQQEVQEMIGNPK